MYAQNIQTITASKKVEFNGIKTVYPCEETLKCFFTLPEYYKPERNDWIGIIPTGWISIKEAECRKMVVPEMIIVGTPMGNCEFESYNLPTPTQTTGIFGGFESVKPHQKYQFIYVKNGEQVFGISTPFNFIQTTPKPTKTQYTQIQYPITGTQFTTTTPKSFEQIEHEIRGLEQLIGEYKYNKQTPKQFRQQQQQQQTLTTCYWETRIGRIEHLCREKSQLNQCKRRLEQIKTITQLKSLQRHLIQIETIPEEEIKQYLPSTTVFEKRVAMMHKLRQTLKECERKLNDLQQIDQEHYTNFEQTLRIKCEEFKTKQQQKFNGEQQFDSIEFEMIFVPFLTEQVKLGQTLNKANEELKQLIQECGMKMQQAELEPLYTQYKVQPVGEIVRMFEMMTGSKFEQFEQVQKRIEEQKMKLKFRELLGFDCDEQTIKHFFGMELIGKFHLIKQELQKIKSIMISGQWIDKKCTIIAECIELLNEMTTMNKSWEEKMLRKLHLKLKEFEFESIEIQQFFLCHIQMPKMAEICAQVHRELKEKNEKLHFVLNVEHIKPVEFVLRMTMTTTTTTPMMTELYDLEKKVCEMRALVFATLQYIQIEKRMHDLETKIIFKQSETIVKPEIVKKIFEQLRYLRCLVDEHFDFMPQFLTQTDMFFLHQQKFGKVCFTLEQLEREIGQLFVTYFIKEEKPEEFLYVKEKFIQLVGEFQATFPECFTHKIAQIYSFLRHGEQTLRLKSQFSYAQLLKEKLGEFEMILSQPECEIACMATLLFPQSSIHTPKSQKECLKFLIRECKTLKSKMHFIMEKFFQQEKEQQLAKISFLSGLEKELNKLTLQKQEEKTPVVLSKVVIRFEDEEIDSEDESDSSSSSSESESEEESGSESEWECIARFAKAAVEQKTRKHHKQYKHKRPEQEIKTITLVDLNNNNNKKEKCGCGMQKQIRKSLNEALFGTESSYELYLNGECPSCGGNISSEQKPEIKKSSIRFF